jgi:hypothetical protein
MSGGLAKKNRSSSRTRRSRAAPAASHRACRDTLRFRGATEPPAASLTTDPGSAAPASGRGAAEGGCADIRMRDGGPNCGSSCERCAGTVATAAAATAAAATATGSSSSSAGSAFSTKANELAMPSSAAIWEESKADGWEENTSNTPRTESCAGMGMAKADRRRKLSALEGGTRESVSAFSQMMTRPVSRHSQVNRASGSGREPTSGAMPVLARQMTPCPSQRATAAPSPRVRERACSTRLATAAEGDGPPAPFAAFLEFGDSRFWTALGTANLLRWSYTLSLRSKVRALSGLRHERSREFSNPWISMTDILSTSGRR